MNPNLNKLDVDWLFHFGSEFPRDEKIRGSTIYLSLGKESRLTKFATLVASELGKSFLVVYQLARNGVDQGSAGRDEPSSSRDVRGPPRMRTSKNCFGKGREN